MIPLADRVKFASNTFGFSLSSNREYSFSDVKFILFQAAVIKGLPCI